MQRVRQNQRSSDPLLVINFKNYQEASGAKALQIRKIAEEASKKFNVQIAVAPSQVSLFQLANGSSIPVLAQHVDDREVGSTTGYVIPEILKDFGVKGSLINHSEHRISEKEIVNLVKRLNVLGMISIVCVGTTEELTKYAKLSEPTYFAIEPPELIGTGHAVSKENPEIISKAAEVIASTGKKSQLLCGAGIVTGDDVSKALSLGSVGILVASGVIKAKDIREKIDELAKPFSR